MRLDHLLSREYTTTDLVRVAWREGSFEFVVTSSERNSLRQSKRSEDFREAI